MADIDHLPAPNELPTPPGSALVKAFSPGSIDAATPPMPSAPTPAPVAPTPAPAAATPVSPLQSPPPATPPVAPVQTQATPTPAPGIDNLPTPPDSMTRRATSPSSSIADLPAPPSSITSSSDPMTAIDKEIHDRSFFNRPLVSAQPTTEAEIQAIADKHGVSEAALRDLAPYFGASMQGSLMASSDTAKRAAGFVGESVGLGVPQKLYKISQQPDMEKALDDLQNLAQGRQSYVEKAGELVAPIGPLGSASATLGKAALKGAAVGAIAGAAGASSGQEVQGAAFGAAAGAGLSGLVHGVVSRMGARAATPIEQESAKALVDRSAPDIDKGVDDILQSRAESRPDVQAQVLDPDNAPTLTPEASEQIVRDNMDPDLVDRMLDPSEEENHLMLQRASEENPELMRAGEENDQAAIMQTRAQDIVDQQKQDFAEFLDGSTVKTPEAADEIISRYTDVQGGQAALQDRYTNFERQQAGEQFVLDNHLRPGLESNFANKQLNNISDAQFVLRDIDNRMHLGLEPIHNDLNTKYNRMTIAGQGFEKDLDSIFSQARATGVDQTIVDSDKLYQARLSGDLSGLSPQEIEISQRFDDYFRKGLQFVNGVDGADHGVTPLSIPALDNYTPIYRKPFRELESTIQQKLGSVGPDLSQATDKATFQGLVQTTPALQDVVEGMTRLDPTAEKASSGPQLLAQVHDLFDTQAGRTRLGTSAKSALERTGGEDPLWMRETNLYKLANQWASGTLRHLYLRDPIEKMAGKLTVLRRAGADLEAGYVQNLISDLQGARAGTAAAYSAQVGDAYSRGIDRLLGHSQNPMAQASAGVAKALPTIMRDSLRNIYGNVLGLSARADILHLLHPFVKTLPEIGATPYGSYTLMRGTLNALLNFSEMHAKVFQEGLLPAEMIPQYRRAIEEGIRRSSLYALPMQTVQKMSEVAMYTFRKLDIMNRMVTTSMADSIIDDMSKGSKAAQSAFSRLPPDIQRSISAAGDKLEASRRLAVYLNASTGYNYNRASMSEFGRTMGPFFSTFTKWPTATAGEIISEYRQKGLTRGTIRNMEKFLAPLLVLKGADALIRHYYTKDGQMTDRQNMVFGHGGLESAAPIGSVGAILTGKLFAPPAVDAVLRGIIEPIKSGDPAKAKAAMVSALQEFTPGSVYVRFLTDDLVTYITGHRPEGQGFIDRTKAGAREINRMGR